MEIKTKITYFLKLAILFFFYFLFRKTIQIMTKNYKIAINLKIYKMMTFDKNDLLQCKQACRRMILANYENGLSDEESLENLLDLQEEGFFGNLDVLGVWDEEMQ